MLTSSCAGNRGRPIEVSARPSPRWAPSRCCASSRCFSRQPGEQACSTTETVPEVKEKCQQKEKQGAKKTPQKNRARSGRSQQKEERGAVDEACTDESCGSIVRKHFK